MHSEPGRRSNGGQSRPSSAPCSTLDVGATVDRRYTLKRLLASGGGAYVHAAQHLYTGRSVAVKTSRDDTPHARERALREVRALARLQGPGIVEMLDAGEENGSPYLVLELLEGRTVAGLIAARGQLSIAETLRIGVETARSLARCHENGIVHRDVKPSNLFVVGGAGPQTRLLDFGIAKLDAHVPAQEKLTQEHSLLGTPEYMAPESLLCSPDADHRSDIYALGVTLYECLTGAVPFDGGYADVLLKLSTTAPPSVAHLRPDLPLPVARAIDRCLARNPGDRFQSAEELASSLSAAWPDPGVPIDLFGRALPASPLPEGRGGSVTLADSPAARGVTQDWRRRRAQARAPYITLARLTRASGERLDGRVEEVSEGG